MWRRVELRNYRSIEHVIVDLAPFTVLVGANGSGKSNFADALVFVRDVATDALSAIERRGGIVGVRRWRPTKPTDVTLDVRCARSRDLLDGDFVRHRMKIHSGKTGEWSFREERIEKGGAGAWHVLRKGEAYSVGGDPPGGTQLRLWPLPRAGRILAPTASLMVLERQYARVRPAFSALANVRRLRLDTNEMRKPQTATESTRVEEEGANIATAYRGLPPLRQAAVKQAMQRIVPGLTDIRVEGLERYVILRFAQRQGAGDEAAFGATEMSEGAIRALGILVAAEQMTRDELLIVEEPESGVHVGAARLLFEVLKDASRRGAVLVTTHSADLLDAAKDEEILVCDYRDGLTQVGPLASAQRALVKDGLFSIAELMRSEPLRIEGQAPQVVEP